MLGIPRGPFFFGLSPLSLPEVRLVWSLSKLWLDRVWFFTSLWCGLSSVKTVGGKLEGGSFIVRSLIAPLFKKL